MSGIRIAKNGFENTIVRKRAKTFVITHKSCTFADAIQDNKTRQSQGNERYYETNAPAIDALFRLHTGGSGKGQPHAGYRHPARWHPPNHRPARR